MADEQKLTDAEKVKLLVFTKKMLNYVSHKESHGAKKPRKKMNS